MNRGMESGDGDDPIAQLACAVDALPAPLLRARPDGADGGVDTGLAAYLAAFGPDLRHEIAVREPGTPTGSVAEAMTRVRRAIGLLQDHDGPAHGLDAARAELVHARRVLTNLLTVPDDADTDPRVEWSWT
ncbi:hypothetical protein LZG04_12070 [Saccharothrix sp. S26]|uniref:hypothetical protein n=1 Tax=Saccharothrix sp. S26 TaxID=2907215 RepID=UPI001F388143|nr:hypothetical protein [Saccharothrix sp. S26]MCE6995532.1 hypothetical protein [Saccharothrix sp. S26]